MKKLKYTALAAALVVASACGDTSSTALSQLNLDRPVDIAFACYGGLRLTHGGPVDDTNRDDIQVTAMPSAACEARSGAHDASTPQPTVPGQEDLTDAGGKVLPVSVWYGLILQQGPGTVALAQFSTKPSAAFGGGVGGDVIVKDADPLTPGKNGISVGEDPLAIVVDQAGCFAVTANAGSYDLSTLELNTAFDSDPAVTVARLEVHNAGGTRLAARPVAMAAPPQTPVIGNTCAATATGLVYVAYPGCRLVAGIDVATGTVTQAIQYDTAGTPALLGAAATAAITCPDESSGEPALAGVRPVTLDIELDARTQMTKMAIGAANSSSVAILEMSNDGIPQSLRQIALEDPNGKLGVTDVAIGPVIGMGGSRGAVIDDAAPGGDFQFVYAVASDATVRVMDVHTLDKECDTQVDPRYLGSVRSVRTLSCLPVGDPATPPRRSQAKSPGIELIGDAVPTSIDISRADVIPGDQTDGVKPTKMIGYFGFISSRSGATFVLTVDDDNFPDLFEPNSPLDTPIPLAIANQLRDAIVDRGLEAATISPAPESIVTRQCTNLGDLDSNGTPLGGPRVASAPVRALPNGTFASEKVSQLPTIRQVLCGPDPAKGVLADTTVPVSELSFPADATTRYTAFPDIRGLRGDENWSIAWEGILSRDNSAVIDGPPVRESIARVDALGLHMIDQTKPYCDAGVEVGDFVQFRGCDPAQGDDQCPTGYRCYTHPESQVTGLGACMLVDEAERLAAACKPFLTSFRRYTVAKSASGELLLVPRRHELRSSPLEGCTDDAQCKVLADYGAKTLNSANPKDDTGTSDPSIYACVADPLREPNPGTGKRCEAVCTQQSDCQPGLFCQASEDGRSYCMEGVTPPQACVNAPQRYELHAGEAFTVIGSRTGYVHPIIADASGTCVVNPAADRLQVGRFALEPRDPTDPDTIVRCDPTADPVTGALPGGGYEPNPCTETASTTDYQPLYLPGTCTFASPSTAIVTRSTPGVKFRNRQFNLNFVDTYYPGDQTCIGDRLGPNGMPLQKVPLVFGGFEVDFRQLAGFVPLVLPIQPAFPVKVVHGPTNSVWVIDNGDFISTSNVAPSTRGKVFRVEAESIGIVNTLQ